MFKFGEGALEDEIKDTEISFSEVPMFNTDISTKEAMSFWDKQFESVPEISMKDILNRSEDEFSFDYDLSNMKELMDKFDNSKWADLSEDERMDLVEQAVSKIAEQWNEQQRDGRTDWTDEDIYEWRHDPAHQCSWHERCDTKTMDLVPYDIHSYCKHLGGVSECKARDSVNDGGGFDE